MRLDRSGGKNMTIATAKAQNLSPTLRGVKPLGKEDAAKWIRYWEKNGLFA